MPQRTIEDDFNDALDRLERDAKTAGLTWSSVCRLAGASRATPERWHRSPPATVQILANMQRIVAAELSRSRTFDRKDWPAQLAKRGIDDSAVKK